MQTIAAALAVAAATVAAATPAGASSAGRQSSVHEAAFLAIVSTQQPDRIQARFTVPAVRCTSTPSVEDATVQIFALSGLAGRAGQPHARARSLPAATPGLLTAAAAIVATCSAGSASYQADALGIPLAMTVSPGDAVLLTASFDQSVSPQRRTATVDDITTGVQLSQMRGDNGQFLPFSAFTGVKRSGREPIPDFGAIHWSQATINGAPIGSAQTLFGFDLVASVAHPRVLIRTSALSRSGDSFTNTWVAGS